MTSSPSGACRAMGPPSCQWHAPSTRLVATWHAFMQSWVLTRRARRTMQILSALDDARRDAPP